MCSRQEPDHLKANDGADRNALKLMYCGFAPMNVRGPMSGQLYHFSRLQPVQMVDSRDAVSILRTRLFRNIR
jgi:hypothetical protein